MSKFTALEKFQCADREVKQRRHVYGRLVANGKMTETFAERQTAIMEEIADEYRVKAEAEEASGRLL